MTRRKLFTKLPLLGALPFVGWFKRNKEDDIILFVPLKDYYIPLAVGHHLYWDFIYSQGGKLLSKTCKAKVKSFTKDYIVAEPDECTKRIFNEFDGDILPKMWIWHGLKSTETPHPHNP